MNTSLRKAIAGFFTHEPIKVIYLFGSRAKGTAGPMSDYDFAVLFSRTLSSRERFDKKIAYMSELAKIITVNEEKVDVVDLNSAHFPIAFAAISGKVLLCLDENARVEFEVKTMRDMHTDFYYLKRDYDATIEAIKKGTYFS